MTATRNLKMKVRHILWPLYAGLVVAYAFMLLSSLRLDTAWGQDFTAFYTGWAIALSADHSNLYDLETQRKHQAEILAKDGHQASRLQDGLLPYLNPPHVTALFAPLALLSRRTALAVWVVIQIGLLILFWRTMRDRRAFLLFAATPLVLLVIAVGALSLLVALAIWKAYEAFKDGRDVHAAMWLALATVKPQMCLLPIIGLIAVRPNLIWKLSLAVIVPALASIALVGLKPFTDYPALLQTVSNMPGRYSLLIATNSTFRGFLFLVSGYQQVAPVNLISSIALLGAIGVTILLWRSQVATELQIALTVLLGLFFGPHVNPVDDVLLVLPAFILYRHSKYLTRYLAMIPLLLLVEWRFVLGFRPCSVVIYSVVISLFYRAITQLQEGQTLCAQESAPFSRAH